MGCVVSGGKKETNELAPPPPFLHLSPLPTLQRIWADQLQGYRQRDVLSCFWTSGKLHPISSFCPDNACVVDPPSCGLDMATMVSAHMTKENALG